MKNITLSALLISSLFCVTVQAMNEKEKKENRGITIQSSHIEYESDKKNTLLTDEQIAKLTEELAGLRFVKMEAEKIEAETKDELAQLTLTREKVKHGWLKSHRFHLLFNSLLISNVFSDLLFVNLP